VDVIVRAAELVQLRADVGAHVRHELVTAGEDRVGEGARRYLVVRTTLACRLTD
jgi:hypothetical protein